MERARGGHWLPQERQARRTNLMRGRAALEQQIERLTEAYLAGIVSLEEYQRRRRDAEARLAALARQDQDLRAEIERQSSTASLAAHAEAFCQRVRCGLAEADFERRRALVELLIDRVIVTDSEVEIRYVFPTSSKGERERFCRLRMDYQPRLLDHDDPGELQQLSQIAAWHLMARHLLASTRHQGRHKPDGATETVCSRGEGGSPSP
jgi:site-specific DNA recombinase